MNGLDVLLYKGGKSAGMTLVSILQVSSVLNFKNGSYKANHSIYFSVNISASTLSTHGFMHVQFAYVFSNLIFFQQRQVILAADFPLISGAWD